MASTAVYGLPYPGTGDSPHGPNQIQALAQAVENKFITNDADRVLIKSLLSGYTPPAQTGSGDLASGGTGAVIKQVAIPDPGFPYHILAEGSLGWAMKLATQPNQLIEATITIDTTTYNTNVLTGGFGLSFSLGAVFNQPTVPLAMDRSDAFGPMVGAKTVRLIARNSSTGAVMVIPAAARDTKLHVRIVPA